VTQELSIARYFHKYQPN